MTALSRAGAVAWYERPSMAEGDEYALALSSGIGYGVPMKAQSTDSGLPPPSGRGAHIATVAGHCEGKPHIAGHRIKVQHVAVWHERQGKSPDEIVAEHPGLTLADVYAALAYYYDHRDEINADIHADEQFASALQAQSRPSRLVRRIVSHHAPNDPLSPR
jgi:uncharacterized protein (DUF433 family)